MNKLSTTGPTSARFTELSNQTDMVSEAIADLAPLLLRDCGITEIGGDIAGKADPLAGLKRNQPYIKIVVSSFTAQIVKEYLEKLNLLNEKPLGYEIQHKGKWFPVVFMVNGSLNRPLRIYHSKG